MTLSSAYIELFIRGKSPGDMSGGNVRIPLVQVLRMTEMCSVIVSLELRSTPRTLREESLSATAMSGLANSGKRLVRPLYTTSSFVLDGWINMLFAAAQFLTTQFIQRSGLLI